LSCGFFYLLSSSFFSTNLRGRRCLPYLHTWCGLSANLEYRSEMYCTRLAGNTGRKKSPSRHHHTTLSGYIFATKACIDNRKNVKQHTSSICPDNMVNFSPLTAEIGSGVWGTPAKFPRVSRLGSVTARHSSSGRQPNFAALNKQRHMFGRAAIPLGTGPHSS